MRNVACLNLTRTPLLRGRYADKICNVTCLDTITRAPLRRCYVGNICNVACLNNIITRTPLT